ncbi:MAG TPA: DNA polymerase III subunit gamma/tau [Hyphomicrobiaceae bacterium]|nr:DNA polymerase III subunit gamma/tau [Hyphomicrobiaceae bacterium]
MARKKASSSEPQSREGAVSPGVEPVPAPYVVLARKYRPETFADLIGQAAMVRTLRNAFATDRIAQGYMLTGVRGVGKTTTARILARAFNYAKPGLPDRPTIDMDGYGEHCLDIIQSRHPDVIEMDAASHTGVDNVRELIESAHYRPVLARYKVFIIDEVHMLSKGAFNALLKTLEEPPPHVKFIFATTEVRKVPVTVLSRCQRFDLRRVDVPELVSHFAKIVEREGLSAEPDALTLIARAAEGSVRDGLSMLDRAIAMGSGAVTAATVREMLGLADRSRIFDLLEEVLRGRAGPAISALSAIIRDGAEPSQVLADLAEAVHAATRIKVAGDRAAGEALAAEEKRRAAALAGAASIPVLARAWQMLLKGLEETQRAPDPLASAEMVLIRMAYAADLPSPDEIIRSLGRPGGDRAAPAGPQGTAGEDHQRDQRGLFGSAPPTPPSPSTGPASFSEVVELVGARRDAKLKVHLEEHVSLVRFEAGRIELRLLDGAPPSLAGELAEKLTRWSGRRWIVAVSSEPGAPPLGEERREREAAELAGLRQHPALKAVLEAFPSAEIKAVRPLAKGQGDDSATG